MRISRSGFVDLPIRAFSYLQRMAVRALAQLRGFLIWSMGNESKQMVVPLVSTGDG
jgi:hypothetical protein